MIKILFGWFAATSCLTDNEITHFQCQGGTYHQYHTIAVAGSQPVSDQASSANNYNGCFNTGTCYSTDYTCSVSATKTGNFIDMESNSIADHNLWALSDPGYVEVKDIRARFPAVPTLLSMQEALNQPVIFGAMGFATNGVVLRNPYNSNTCCDGTFSRSPYNDYCNGDTNGGHYSYNFYAGNNDASSVNCPMGCTDSGVSPIIGVALDGFAIYGPMQYYSKSEGRMYANNCASCELIQLNGDHTDTCGGIDVADGSSADGTHYR